MVAAPHDDQPEAGSSTGPHRMRIASGGSIQSYVKFALDFLQNNPTRYLILHTKPPSPLPTPAAGAPQPRSTSTLQPCTLNAPRLISVAELIKREYMAILNGSGKGKGKHKAVGIWQYTKSGLVDPSELGLGLEGTSGNDGANGLVRILEGKLKPKMTHYPYLEITLSTHPLGLEKEPDTSCQYLVATRHRNRKPAKDGAKQPEPGADVEMQDADSSVDEGVPIPRAPVPVPAAGAVGFGASFGKKGSGEGLKRKSKGSDAAEGVKKKKIKAAV